MTDEPLPPLRYVLSAGRTGTVFLARFLNVQPGVIAAHEPDTSRYQMMLANLRNDWDVGGALLRSIFNSSRKRRLDAAGAQAYVEINPLLCPMTDLLPMVGRQLRIVHMVRDPATWAVSIIAHKASKRYRYFIDYVPFGKPYPAPRPVEWANLGDYERALYRWNWCNARIGELSSLSNNFAVVRYEDLFGNSGSSRAAAMETIFTTLGLRGEMNDYSMSARANPSVTGGEGPDWVAAKRICGELACTYGYDY